MPPKNQIIPERDDFDFQTEQQLFLKLGDEYKGPIVRRAGASGWEPYSHATDYARGTLIQIGGERYVISGVDLIPINMQLEPAEDLPQPTGLVGQPKDFQNSDIVELGNAAFTGYVEKPPQDWEG